VEPTPKERILKKIRKALIEPTDQPFPNLDGTSPVFHQPNDSLDVVFAEEFTKIQGQFIYCEQKSDVAKQLSSLCNEKNWNHIFCWETEWQKFLQASNFDRIRVGNNLEKADAGFTTCELLVARTGSIILSSKQASGRRLSIFPPVHLVVAFNNQLVYDLKDALPAIMQKYQGNLPSLLSIASGPSRTADIEKTLVLGAHGPKEVYVFFIDHPA
jgi:L-lactate dehydrogenase complex protein LldG